MICFYQEFYLTLVVDLVEEFQGWEMRSNEKFTILLFFLRKLRRWAFLSKNASGLGSTNLQRILRFNFSSETDFEPTTLLLKKAARYQPFLVVVRCLFHNHLRLKRSGLLNVYLNCKFESSLLSSYLCYSLFN